MDVDINKNDDVSHINNDNPDYDSEYDDCCPICYLSSNDDPLIEFKKCSQCKKNTCVKCILILIGMSYSKINYKCPMCRFSNSYVVIKQIKHDVRFKRLIIAIESNEYWIVKSILDNNIIGKFDMSNDKISSLIYDSTSKKILELLIERKCIASTPYIQFLFDHGDQYDRDARFDFKSYILNETNEFDVLNLKN